MKIYTGEAQPAGPAALVLAIQLYRLHKPRTANQYRYRKSVTSPLYAS